MNIYQQFEDSLRCAAALPALISGIGNDRRVVTFAELERNVDGVVTIFHQRGLRAGDTVLLAVPISIDTYIVMLALLKAGMVIMHIDPAHGPSTVARILKNWPPDGIVASRPILMLGLLFPELRRIPGRFVVGGSALGAVRLCNDIEVQGQMPMTERSSADSAILRVSRRRV